MAIKDRVHWTSGESRIGSVIVRLIKPFYNVLLRPWLPRKIGVYNGIAVKRLRLFDAKENYPDYEAPLINGLRRSVRKGDTVVIIGGGYGVSAVVAARLVGPKGRVMVYEASGEQVQLARETTRLNGLADRVTIHHAVVGPAIDVWGDKNAVGNRMDPGDLPEADVLEVDCEGAEGTILDRLETIPPTIVVEYHTSFGSPRTAIENRLVENGYTVEFLGIDNTEIGAGVLLANED